MSLNAVVHLSKMTYMFLAELFSGPLLFFSGQWPAPPASELYNFTATDVCNTTLPGTVRFRNEVGLEFMIEAMQESSDFIFKVFKQENISDRKHKVGINVHMEVHDYFEGAIGRYIISDSTAQTQTIHISAEYMENIPSDTLTDRVRELVYHEMTHVWQWYGDESSDSPPSGLFEGIAEYVPLVAGLKNYGDNKPGGGDKWNEGYEVTASFLAYCESLRPGFVALMNKALKYYYNDYYFEELLGKSVEDLWRNYKNKYHHENHKVEISYEWH